MRRFAIKQDGKAIAQGLAHDRGAYVSWTSDAPDAVRDAVSEALKAGRDPEGVEWLETPAWKDGYDDKPLADPAAKAEHDRGKADAAKCATVAADNPRESDEVIK